jgi:hypothetical protein
MNNQIVKVDPKNQQKVIPTPQKIPTNSTSSRLQATQAQTIRTIRTTNVQLETDNRKPSLLNQFFNGKSTANQPQSSQRVNIPNSVYVKPKQVNIYDQFSAFFWLLKFYIRKFEI